MSIYTDDGYEIPWMDWIVDNYIDKNTILLGPTKSGKTYIIKAILYLLRQLIPNVLLVAPKTTQVQYVGLIPEICMLEDLTKDRMEKLWKRQEDAKQAYDIANDMPTLESVFRKCNDRQGLILVEAIKKASSTRIDKIERDPNIEFNAKKTQRSLIEALSKKKMLEIYKKSIRTYREALLKSPHLSIREKIAVEFLDFNPRLLFIIDDCSEMFSNWHAMFPKGKSVNVFECIFFRGRWAMITMIIAAHDDTYLKPGMRKNASNIIWTHTTSLGAYINRPNSGFSLQDKKLMAKVGDRVFTPEVAQGKMTDTLQKMVYTRVTAPAYRYTIAEVHDDFKFGSTKLWEADAKMPRKEADLEQNQFLKKEYVKPKPRAKFKRD